MNATTTQPYSEDAEKGVISSLLQAPGDVFARCSQHISARSFYNPAHRILFETIGEWPPDKEVDFVWLKETLKARNQLAEVGDKERVSELYHFVPTAANAQYYIEIVAEKYALSKPLDISRQTMEQS